MFNKWIIGGVAFLIVLSVACVLWYQHDTAADRKAAADAEKLLRQLEITEKVADTDSDTEQAGEVTAESTTQNAEKPIKERSSAETDNSTDDTTNPATASTHTQQTDNTTEVRVSPHGLGPYPKVPPDYPGGDDPKFWEYPRTKGHELMSRVCIRLWKEGKYTHGSSISNGLVYVTLPNTLIVRWGTEQSPTGTRRYAKGISWCPEAESFQREMRFKTIYEGDFPSHFVIVDHKDAGIDPYEYLDLPR